MLITTVVSATNREKTGSAETVDRRTAKGKNTLDSHFAFLASHEREFVEGTKRPNTFRRATQREREEEREQLLNM